MSWWVSNLTEKIDGFSIRVFTEFKIDDMWYCYPGWKKWGQFPKPTGVGNRKWS